MVSIFICPQYERRLDMGKLDTKMLWHNAKRSLSKHSPEILIGLGITGFASTVILAVRATPKALRLINAEKEKKRDNLTPVETIKVAWKPYIPAVVTGGVSVACVIGANTVNSKRNAALATAYQLSAAALTEYKDKVIETIGEKKERDIREKISKKRVEQTSANSGTVYITGDGDSLFLEPISKRLFKSDIERVRSVVNTLNEQLFNDPFGVISLSDFYDGINLEQTDISDDIGWNLSNGAIKIEFHPAMSDTGKPCLAIYYINPPKYGYDE